ncbi:MAG TPA: hypothetical protein EYG78_00855 [Sulfurovum sp.]|nr:hypothetical protein [Sulfurovum sp.]
MRLILLLSVALAFSFGGISESAEQKKIETKADFKQLEKVLLQSQMYEPEKSNYYLGLLYSSTFKLKNGEVIKPNYKKSLAYFQRSYEFGNKMAAFNISMILTSQGKIDEGIFILDQTIRGMDTKTDIQDISTGSYLSVVLASLIMDTKANDEEAVSLGISHLKKYVEISNIPTGDYILSRMYLSKGDLNSANKYLTKACKNPTLPKEIATICSSMKAR